MTASNPSKTSSRFPYPPTPFPVVVGPLTAMAMMLANGETENPRGGWEAVLVNQRTLRVEWKCDHRHSSRTKASLCAREKWFSHHG